MSDQLRRAGRLVLLLTIISVGCQLPSPDLTNANKEVVRQFFAALDAQDFNALADLMDDDYVIRARSIGGAE